MASSSVTRSRDVKLRGIAASPGIAIGRVLRLDERGRHQFYYIGVSAAQVRMEIRRLREALEEGRAQLRQSRSGSPASWATNIHSYSTPIC